LRRGSLAGRQLLAVNEPSNLEVVGSTPIAPILWGRSSAVERQIGTKQKCLHPGPTGAGKPLRRRRESRGGKPTRARDRGALFADGGHRHDDRRPSPTRAPPSRAAPVP
jgi:hypothetical protein